MGDVSTLSVRPSRSAARPGGRARLRPADLLTFAGHVIDVDVVIKLVRRGVAEAINRRSFDLPPPFAVHYALDTTYMREYEDHLLLVRVFHSGLLHFPFANTAGNV